jgi:hypothetical protein
LRAIDFAWGRQNTGSHKNSKRLNHARREE